jgi:hypothetical protein
MSTPDHSDHPVACLVCESVALSKVEGFAALPRITSDCRPFPAGGELSVCAECGTVQKQPSPVWLGEIHDIYANYASYYQSGGDEQIVFDRESRRPRRRSDVLMEKLAAGDTLPVKGFALDIGCGNGVTLTSMSHVFPQWRLSGYELGDSTLPKLSTIQGFERLYTASLSSIEQKFDLVTMIHSLEHFPSPKEILDHLRNIVGTGLLFIEVCNVVQNPFDIVVADHVIHFSHSSLCRLLRNSGFSVARAATDWVPKEISLLARRALATSDFADSSRSSGSDVLKDITAYVKWLQDLTTLAHNIAMGRRPMAIFGTSIAATWLGSQLEGLISFFVDEDESRVGRTHLGRPIIRPADVPNNSVVYLALAPTVAEFIARKLSSLDFEMVLPPRLGQPA